MKKKVIFRKFIEREKDRERGGVWMDGGMKGGMEGEMEGGR